MKEGKKLIASENLMATHPLTSTVEPPIKDTPIKDTPIKDTIEITSEQRTRFNVPNGNFPIVLIHS